MEEARYVQVILPLKLNWEPWYRLHPEDGDVCVGSRVRVNLSGREYVAVVSTIGRHPDIPESKVRFVTGVENGLEKISSSELDFWRFLSSYYLCSIGEVYKYVYPAGKTAVEAKRANKKGAGEGSPDKPKLSRESKDAVIAVLDAFVSKKPVLLQAGRKIRAAVFDELARRTMESGRDVLILRPGVSRESYVTQRELAKAVRADAAVMIDGSSNNIFLPFTKLGLVIVDDEHDSSYKHSAMAPRYQARDAAVALASQHDADILLVSSTPSLESIFNVRTSKYLSVRMPDDAVRTIPLIIGTVSEYAKHGMEGELSKKLISRIEAVQGRKLLVTPWPLKETLKYRKLKTVALNKLFNENLSSYDLVALVNAEALFSRNDFRADERALQLLRRLETEVSGELVIQTKDASHPLFECDHEKYFAQLMEERKLFGYPPYSRMVDVIVSDTNQSRCAKMTGDLLGRLGGSLRILMPRDRMLAKAKASLAANVTAFESERKYFSHISIDVDP